MSTNCTEPGKAVAPKAGLDSDFTNAAATSAGPKANPRLASIVESLTRYLHDFCKENKITAEEFATAIDFVGLLSRA